MNSALLTEPIRQPTFPRPRRQRPRLGFLGVGWIGRHRLEAIARSGLAQITAIADSATEQATQAARIASDAKIANSLDELLELGLDGLVVATPSALHAEQTIAALERGVAVFCQKPLGRTAKEAQAVVHAAQKADRLLGVDLSYRYVTAVREVHQLVRNGELGSVFAVEMVFHNAYGPDKPWFYDRNLSGGGCVIDLGIHLVDLALWNLNFPQVRNVTSRLYSQGQPMHPGAVEDYATARLDLDNGATVQVACSWKLPAGAEAIISAAFYGTRGGAMVHNVGGSFYNFVAERFHGTRRERLASPTEEWGGRAAVDWVQRLALDRQYNPEIETIMPVAATLDAIYQS